MNPKEQMRKSSSSSSSYIESVDELHTLSHGEKINNIYMFPNHGEMGSILNPFVVADAVHNHITMYVHHA